MPTPMPVCLACRRSLDPEPDDLAITLDGPDLVVAARELAREEPDADVQAILTEVLRGLCRACGRPL